MSMIYLPDYVVLYERRVGRYHHLSRQWGDFIEKYQDSVTDKLLFFERTYDDPVITEMDGCLYDICRSVDRSTFLVTADAIAKPLEALYTKEVAKKQYITLSDKVVCMA